VRFLLPATIAVPLLLSSQVLAAVHVMTNGRITIDFADPEYGATTDSDRIDFLLWIGSNGNSIGNLATNYPGSSACGESLGSFGQSYSNTADSSKGGTGPYFIIPGVESSVSGNLINTKNLTDIHATDCLRAAQGY